MQRRDGTKQVQIKRPHNGQQQQEVAPVPAARAASDRRRRGECRHPAQDEGAPRPLRPPPGTRSAAHVLPGTPRGMDMTVCLYEFASILFREKKFACIIIIFL